VEILPETFFFVKVMSRKKTCHSKSGCVFAEIITVQAQVCFLILCDDFIIDTGMVADNVIDFVVAYDFTLF
jgi:hypothetical protein